MATKHHAAQRHLSAAEEHDNAAREHREAARHFDTGEHETGGHRSSDAIKHSERANKFSGDAMQAYLQNE